MRDKANDHIPQGRQVERIIFPNQDQMVADATIQLFFVNDFHGEYDLDWIVYEHDGVEVARYNCKNIETIIWKLP